MYVPKLIRFLPIETGGEGHEHEDQAENAEPRWHGVT
jgi:hypothetical protein